MAWAISLAIFTYFGCSSGGFQECPGTHSLPQSSQRTGNQLGRHPGKDAPESWSYFHSTNSSSRLQKLSKGGTKKTSSQKQAMLIFRLKQTYDGITKQSFCHWNAKNRLDSYLTRSILNNQSTFWAVSPGNSYSWHLRNLHRNYFEQRKAFCTHPIYIANT